MKPQKTLAGRLVPERGRVNVVFVLVGVIEIAFFLLVLAVVVVDVIVTTIYLHDNGFRSRAVV